MRRLHNLWILHDVGVDVVHAVQIVSTLGGKGRVEAAGTVSQGFEIERLWLLPSLSCMLEHPICSSDDDLALFAFYSFPVD